MTPTLSRRAFLLSLAALGAGCALADDASPAQVDAAWKQALRSPWTFEVDDYGTIGNPQDDEAGTWGDVFTDLWVGGIVRPADVIDTVERCQPLADHFMALAMQEMERLQSLPSRARSARARRILAALEADPDEGWRRWVELEGVQGVARYRDEIAAWLEEPADLAMSDVFPADFGGVGRAKAFFEQLDLQALEALGVVIVEGEHPGSSYYAAELRRPVEEANAAAQAMGLPFRFKA